KKKVDPIKINVNGSELIGSSNVKFLGLHLDENLNFHNHCNNIVSKLGSLAFIFRNLRSVDQLITCYYAYVESKLRYGLCFWGRSASFSKVFIAQKRIIRYMAGLRHTESCKELFIKMGIMPLPSLFIYELSIFLFNNRGRFIKVNTCHQYNTRCGNDFYVPFNRLNLSINSLYVLGLKFFNKLPLEIKNVNKPNVFKSKLKTFLFSSCFYSIDEILM
ncbi:hypothetical protein C0J52_17930, partial [Blattella germanica]